MVPLGNNYVPFKRLVTPERNFILISLLCAMLLVSTAERGTGEFIGAIAKPRTPTTLHLTLHPARELILIEGNSQNLS